MAKPLPNVKLIDEQDEPHESQVLWVYENEEPIFEIEFKFERGKTFCRVTPMHLSGRSNNESEIATTFADWS